MEWVFIDLSKLAKNIIMKKVQHWNDKVTGVTNGHLLSILKTLICTRQHQGDSKQKSEKTPNTTFKKFNKSDCLIRAHC